MSLFFITLFSPLFFLKIKTSFIYQKIHQNIEKSAKKNFLDLSYKDLYIKGFSVYLEDVSFSCLSKKCLKGRVFLKKSRVKKIRLRLHLIKSLIDRKLNLSLFVEKAFVSIDNRRKKLKAQKISEKQIHQTLKRTLYSFFRSSLLKYSFIHSELEFFYQKTKWSAKINKLQASTSLFKKSVFIDSDFSIFSETLEKEIKLLSKIRLFKDKIKITSYQSQFKDFLVKLSGSLNFKTKKNSLKMFTSGSFSSLEDLLFFLNPSYQKTQITGNFQTDSFLKGRLIHAKIMSKEFFYQKRSLGSLKADLTYNYLKKDLKFKEILVQKDKGSFKVKKALIKNLSSLKQFNSEFNSYPLSFSQNKNQLTGFLSGAFDCQSSKSHSFKCSMDSFWKNGSWLWDSKQMLFFPKNRLKIEVLSKKKEFTLKIKSLDQLTDHLIEVTSKDRNSIKANYIINFKDLSFFNHFNHQSLKGSLVFQGSFDQKSQKSKNRLAIKNLKLDSLNLGNLRFHLNQNKDRIYISKIRGQIQKSSYKGFFHIKKKNQVSGKISSSKFLLEDIHQSFLQKYPQVSEMKGKVKLDVFIKSVLRKNKTNIQAFAKGSNLSLNHQKFKQANLDLSFSENLWSGVFSLSRFKGLIQGNFKSSKNGFKAEAKIKKLPFSHLESSWKDQLIGSVKGVLNGDFSLEIDKNKNISHKSFLEVTRLQLNDSRLPSLEVQGQSNDNKKTKWSLSFKDSSLQASLESYLDKNELVLDAKKLNLYSFLSAYYPYEIYKTNTYQVSGRLHLFLKNKKDIDKAFIHLDQILIGKKDNPMKLDKKLQIRLDHKKIQFEKFQIKNQSEYISFSHHTDQGIRMKGKLNLSFFEWFSKQIKDLKGESEFNLRVENILKSPLFYGKASINKALLSLKDFPYALEEIKAQMSFQGKSLNLEKLSGVIGGGDLLAKGKIKYQNKKWTPHLKMSIKKIKIHQKDIQLEGNMNLSLTGSYPYLLSGTQSIEKASFIIDTSKIQANKNILPNEYLPQVYQYKKSIPLKLDLNLHSKAPIFLEVLSDAFRFKSYIQGSVKLKGEGSRPVLEGSFESQPGGEFVFRNKTLNIQSGSLFYPSTSFDKPNIDIKANLVLESKENNNTKKHNITLEASGPISNPKLNFRSEPFLSQNDIFSLLAIGVKSSEFEEHLQFEQLTDVDDLQQKGLRIGTTFLGEQLGINQAIEKTLGVSFKLEPDIIGSGGESVTYAKIKKQFDKNLSVSASQSLEKDVAKNIKIEYQFNKKLSLVGVWEEKDKDNLKGSSLKSKDKEKKISLDLQYKKYFK